MLNKLSLLRPVFDQIREADSARTGGLFPLYFDMRAEACGDKIAGLNVAKWISEHEHGGPITILECPNGRTPFMLSDYANVLSENVFIQQADLYDEFEGLDCHTKDNHNALWLLNMYLNHIDFRAKLGLEEPKPRTKKIIFCVLSGSEYNQRRDMDIECVAKSYEMLRRAFGDNVVLLYDKEHPLLNNQKYSFSECIEFIATGAVVIAGDTGFSHCSAAFGTPLVSIYPDWNLGYIDRLSESIKIANWFGIPPLQTKKAFYPNAERDKFKLVELGTDHNWSHEHLVRCVAELYK